MAVGTFYLTTNGGGSCGPINSTTWSTIRGATTAGAGAGFAYTTSKDGATFYLTRMFLPFNTVGLPVGSVVNSATISMYRDDAVRSFLNTQSSTLHLIPSTQTDPTTLASADFDNVSFSSKGSKALSGTTNNTYFDFTLSDLTLIIPGSYSKFAVTNESDLNNTAPTAEAFIGCQYTNAANPPKITINYTPPPGGGLMSFMV